MLLAVAQGSANSPYVAILEYNGNKSKKGYDIALVGKGVTFDSGGISLKPGAGMWDMKQDMAGSAVVVSSLKAAAQQKLKLNIVGVVGLVENMPSGTATRPGDIVTSLSGKTVEILNTDAEGRLVLGDCLTYVEREYKPERIVDLATLTGAIVVALGSEMAGLFSNDDCLSELLSISGEQSGEELWRFPMTDGYRKLIKSDMADVKNLSEGRAAGSITAACFLEEFLLNKTPWAHLDIAGMDIVNPIACILSAAMMLRYSFDMEKEALCIEQAVHRVLDAGYRTQDIYTEGMKKVGTKAMGDAILEAMHV